VCHPTATGGLYLWSPSPTASTAPSSTPIPSSSSTTPSAALPIHRLRTLEPHTSLTAVSAGHTHFAAVGSLPPGLKRAAMMGNTPTHAAGGGGGGVGHTPTHGAGTPTAATARVSAGQRRG
jgi:hypothetical protein